MLAGIETKTSFSSEQKWIDAMYEDYKVSGRKSPTDYVENSNAEDFAESIADFVENKENFKKNFQNR